jgi:hypothetical protein
MNYIPLFGWFAQVFIGLAFVHWGLATIQHMRNSATPPLDVEAADLLSTQ